MSMQQHVYSGGEYAPPSNPYASTGAQGSHGTPMGMHAQGQVHPPPVPSGYPAYALPGSRFPMRGPGPAMVMQGQPYGTQQSAMPMASSQPSVPMQVYGPQHQNPVVVGPLPQRQAPHVYGGAPRNNHPQYNQYQQGFQMTDTSHRFMAATRQPGASSMAHRYPGYQMNQNQMTSEAYRSPNPHMQGAYPSQYYQQRLEPHANQGYGYYGPNNQFQQNLQGSQTSLGQAPRHQGCYSNPMNPMNTSSHGQTNPNMYANSNPVHGAVRGPLPAGVQHSPMATGMQSSHYPVYSQYNPQQMGVITANEANQIPMNNETNNPVHCQNTSHKNTQYLVGQENVSNTMPHQEYVSMPANNQGNVANTVHLRHSHPGQHVPHVPCSMPQHSNFNQRSSYPYPVRFFNQQQPQRHPNSNNNKKE